MDITLSGTEALCVMLSVAIVVTTLIMIIKLRLRKIGNNILSDPSPSFSLNTRNKYSAVNVFKFRGTLSGIGMAAAMVCVLAAFSWTTYDETIYIPEQLPLEDIMEIDIPITDNIKPPPPLPTPPKIEEVIDEIIDEDDEPEFLDQDIENDTPIAEPPLAVKEKPLPEAPPLPSPIIEEDIDEVFKVVQQMPRFPGCENIEGDQKSKADCAQSKLLKYIYGHLNYPAVARENDIEGNVVLQFVVSKNGSIEKAVILRDIGGGCGKVALDVVNKMNTLDEKWIPGKQRGRAVSVLFTLPIRFKLQH